MEAETHRISATNAYIREPKRKMNYHIFINMLNIEFCKKVSFVLKKYTYRYFIFHGLVIVHKWNIPV